MKVSVIIPSLDPDEKLLGVVDSLLAVGFTDLILVNDGSHPECVHYFEEAAARPNVTVLTHEVNKGKGRAMKTAFAYVQEHRPESTGVVTVDGDGQHLAKDVLRVAEAMEAQPGKLHLGVRDFSLPQVPARSRTGNNLTKGVLRLFCGVKVSDSQTGLRAASRKLLPFLLSIQGDRYEYETQMLLDARRSGIALAETVIETVYIEQNQTSHYRPLRDSMRIMKLIVKYLVSSLIATVLDLAIFTVLNFLLPAAMSKEARLFTATAVARVFSTVVNYYINRKYVFRDNGSVKTSLIRYYILAAGQMVCSYGLLSLLNTLFNATRGAQTILKMVADLILFLINYQVQLRWVFACNKKDTEAE